MNTQMLFSATQAAEAVGVATPTITRAIKSGRLSANKTEDGKSYEIEASELFRVYPPKAKPQEEPSKGELLVRIAGLERETELLEKAAETAEAQAEEARKSAYEWKKQAEAVTLLLPKPEEEKPKRKRFLGLF